MEKYYNFYNLIKTFTIYIYIYIYIVNIIYMTNYKKESKI